jgi:hypothetical protein
MPIAFADMGGQFGSCIPDGASDANDKFHALNCFSNQTTGGAPDYPCEDAPPAALNVDAGGPFGDCSPDGVCDGNDVFHALNAFQGTTLCSCSAGAGPAPIRPRPERVIKTGGQIAALVLRPRQQTVKPGGVVQFDIHLGSALPDLRGYQLHLSVAADGRSDKPQLVDIATEESRRWVFAERGAWTAFNVHTGQMVAGLDGDGVPVEAGAHLATFTYRVPRRASGEFAIELLLPRAGGRTFLFPTPAHGRIAISAANPATIYVDWPDFDQETAP